MANVPTRDSIQVIAHERISNAVRELLRQRDIKRSKLAEALGIPETSLHRALKPPDARPRDWKGFEVMAMALFFDVDEQLFFMDDEEMFQEVWHERMRIS